MRRFCFPLLSLLGFTSLLSAQSAKVDLLEMEAKIKAAPESAAFIMGDTIALHPEILRELVESAIVSSKAGSDPARLKEILVQAVRQYPAKSADVAEGAILAAPDQVETIRNIFVEESEKKVVAAPSRENVTPIEKFLATYQTSKPYDPQDAANQAIKAVDDILLKMKEAGSSAAREALASVPNPEIRPETEVFNLSLPDEDIEITTFMDPLIVDRHDEAAEASSSEAVVIDDAALERRLADSAPELSPPAAPLAAAEVEVKADGLASKEKSFWHSTVYPIASPGKKKAALALALPVIRGVPASQTAPRFRFR